MPWGLIFHFHLQRMPEFHCSTVPDDEQRQESPKRACSYSFPGTTPTSETNGLFLHRSSTVPHALKRSSECGKIAQNELAFVASVIHQLQQH